MTLTEYLDSIRDRRITVLGAGVSNMPLIGLLLSHGCDVTVCDQRSAEQMGADAERLASLGAKLRLGADYLEHIDGELIFRTPGLMPFEPHLAAAKERGAIITSEMELFMSLCPCPIIAVTGSDGKTTTSSIIAELLNKSGYTVHLGGNIGHPLLCETPEIAPEDIAVLELSSFQLHSMSCRPRIALITNLTPNHLDKHAGFQDYIDAKRRILDEQTADDRLILNLDDPHTDYYASHAQADIRYFSAKATVHNGVMLRNGVIVRVHDGAETPVIPTDEIKLPGAHNVLNYMAAFAATDGLVNDAVCADVARSFAGVEHRLEHVRTVRGVLYINDSIGSSPTRTAAGLRAMREKPIVIAGGYDKQLPFDTLGDDLCLYAKSVFLTGATAEKIRDAVLHSQYYAEHPIPVRVVGGFRETVLAASEAAQSGDTVLFSPACASFDQFKNFAERGRVFKNIIMELQE